MGRSEKRQTHWKYEIKKENLFRVLRMLERVGFRHPMTEGNTPPI